MEGGGGDSGGRSQAWREEPETVGETGSFSPVWGVYIQLLASLYSQKIPKLQKRPPPRFFHRVRVDGP